MAMAELSAGNPNECLDLLFHAAKLAKREASPQCVAEQVLTLNNMSCCYRHLGKLRTAMRMLEKALALGDSSAPTPRLTAATRACTRPWSSRCGS